MNTMLNTVLEAEKTSTAGSPWPTVIMLVGILLVFWLLILRPQKKQEKAAADMRNSIQVGDEIITIGGIIGTVVIIRDDKMMIETGNDKTKMTILRSAVREVLKDEEAK